jgi:cytochrome c oxidase subunit 4
MSTTAHARPNYVAVWAWLLFLLIISLAAVYLPFSQTITIAIIFVVAAVKAFLVVVNFMHLKFEERLVRLIAIVPVIFFIIMTMTLMPDIVYNR